MSSFFPRLRVGSSSDDPDGLRDDLTMLAAMLKDDKAWLDGVESQVDIDELTKIWKERVREWAYEAEDVLDEWDFEQLRAEVEISPAEVSGRRNAHDAVRFPSMGGRSFRDWVKALMRKRGEIRKSYHQFRLDAPLRRGKNVESLPTSSFPTEREIHGREYDKEILVRFLLHGAVKDELSVVPVLGPLGVGKTTLLQQIYNDKMVSLHFNLKAWICASGRPMLEMMKALAESITGDRCNCTQLAAVHKYLKQKIDGQRFLLVFDDVRCETIDADQWETLRATFSGCANGSVVILSTQDEWVADRTKTVPAYILESLSGDHCWSVFQKTAFSGSLPTDGPLVEIGKKIAKECEGSPLVAKALGVTLRHERDVAEWEEVLSQRDVWHEVVPEVKLSYHRLPAHLKRCFVYCSVFPEGYLFSREELIRLWMAQGFIKKEMGRSWADVGTKYFDDLSIMSFFQQSELDTGAFVMPKILRALARSISDGECVAIENNHHHNRSDLQKARHLSFTPSKIELSVSFLSNATKLRSFLVVPAWPLRDIAHVSLPDSAFHSLSHLHALDLRHTDMRALPDAISNLKHLRYLNLSGTKIKSINASVCRLYFLQTLDLSSTEIRELPDAIGHLRNLLHLYLNVTMITELPKSIGKLSKLQTLQLILTRIEEMPETIRSLKGLRFLCLDVSRVQRGLESICWMSYLQALELQGTDDGESDNNVMSSYSDMEEQFYVQSDQITHNSGTTCDTADSSTSCRQCDHLVDRGSSWMSQTLPQLGQLPLLKMLLMDGMSLEHIGHEFCGSSDRINGFPNLRNLCFKNMNRWKEWDGVTESDFPQLCELTIFNCPRLEGVVPCFHSPLTKLKVERCAVTSIPTLVSLKELDLIACDNLVTLPSLSSLHSLTLMYCPKLTSLPSISLVENWWIEGCDLLTISLSNEFKLSLNTFAR